MVRHPARLSAIGMEVLAAEEVPGPPAHPYEPGVGYPLAFDIGERIAAVSFAALDVHPDVAPGWWCLVEHFAFSEGAWRSAGGEHDNVTSPTPFERPTAVGNSRLDWLDWLSVGPAGEWDDPPRRRRSCFGVAPVRTARLTVAADDGAERDVRITPWSGAFVAISPGERTVLTGYDLNGNVLGSLSVSDGRTPG